MTFTALNPANLESILTSFGQAPFNLEIKTTTNHTYDLPTFAPLTDNVMNIAHTSDSTGTMSVAGVTIPVGDMVSFMFSHQTAGWYALNGGGAPPSGSVEPSSIDQAVTNDFVFPRDVQAGRDVKVGRNIIIESTTGKVIPNADSTHILQVTAANGTTVLLALDSTNGRVGILTSTPGKALDVNGDMRVAGINQAQTLFFNPGLDQTTIDAITSTAVAGWFLYNTTTLTYQFFNGTSWVDMTSSVTPAAGSNNDIQINNGGAFGGTDSLTFDGNILSIGSTSSNGQLDLKAKTTGGPPESGSLILESPSGGNLAISKIISSTAGETLVFPENASGMAINDGNGNLSWVPGPLVVGVTSVSTGDPETFTGSTGTRQASTVNTITITPKSAASRFRVEIEGDFSGNGPTAYTNLYIFNGLNILLGPALSFNDAGPLATTPFSISTIDAPNTTSPVTYSIGVIIDTGSNATLALNFATITVTELAS